MKNYRKAFGFAFAGIARFFQLESNATLHTISAVLAIGAGFYFHISPSEWLWIALSIALVFTTEMFNTAIEVICNKFTKEFDKDIEVIKDVSAGAVLFSAIFALVAGIIIFAPYLFN